MEVSNEDTCKNRVFNKKEDIAILNFLLENGSRADCRKGGIAVWRLMELKNVIPEAKWKLLRHRFHKHILPNLQRYRLSAGKINFFSHVGLRHGFLVKGHLILFQDTSDEETNPDPNFLPKKRKMLVYQYDKSKLLEAPRNVKKPSTPRDSDKSDLLEAPRNIKKPSTPSDSEGCRRCVPYKPLPKILPQT